MRSLARLLTGFAGHVVNPDEARAVLIAAVVLVHVRAFVVKGAVECLGCVARLQLGRQHEDQVLIAVLGVLRQQHGLTLRFGQLEQLAPAQPLKLEQVGLMPTT